MSSDKISVDENLEQMFYDIYGMHQICKTEASLLIFIEYMEKNGELVNVAWNTFILEVTDEKFIERCRIEPNLISTMLTSKELVVDHYSYSIGGLKGMKLSIEDGLFTDDAEYSDEIDIAARVIGAMSHFCDTTGRTVDRTALRKFEKIFKKRAEIVGDRAVLTISGGFVEKENEEEFEKLNFSAFRNELKYEAEATARPLNETPVKSIYAKSFRRVIRFPSEKRQLLISEIMENDFTFV